MDIIHDAENMDLELHPDADYLEEREILGLLMEIFVSRYGGLPTLMERWALRRAAHRFKCNLDANTCPKNRLHPPLML